MASYGASRGELNRDGNQGSATDDYLATPDQRVPLVSSQRIKKIISLCTIKLPVSFFIETGTELSEFKQTGNMRLHRGRLIHIWLQLHCMWLYSTASHDL